MNRHPESRTGGRTPRDRPSFDVEDLFGVRWPVLAGVAGLIVLAATVMLLGPETPEETVPAVTQGHEPQASERDRLDSSGTAAGQASPDARTETGRGTSAGSSPLSDETVSSEDETGIEQSRAGSGDGGNAAADTLGTSSSRAADTDGQDASERATESPEDLVADQDIPNTLSGQGPPPPPGAYIPALPDAPSDSAAPPAPGTPAEQ